MGDDHVYIAYRWWQAMFLTAEELKAKGILPAPSSQKAQLRRCSNVDAAMLTEGFRNLWLSFPETYYSKASINDIECWATISAVLVFIKKNSDINLAKAAGRKAETGKSFVSEIRFAQLQNAKSPDDFLRRLRRILQQIDGTTSVEQLIKDIRHWFNERNTLLPRKPVNRIAVNWAMDYYQAAK